MASLTRKQDKSGGLSRFKRRRMQAAQGTAGEILSVQGVRKSFETPGGEQRALQSVSFSVTRGEFVFITGVTGCGKSTALKLLHGQLVPDAGQIKLGGVDTRLLEQKAFRRRVGYVSQNFDVLSKMTVAENIAYPLETLREHPSRIRHRVEELLQVFDLEHARSRLADDSLSGGERQRLAVARAIAHRPDLLLCDEPTGNLDAATTFGVMRTLNRVSMIGTTVICVTHDPQIVDLMRKRVVTIHEGVVASDRVGGYRLY